MAAPLRITERSLGGALLFQLEGQLVFDEGEQILRDRVAAVVQAGARSLLIDLRNVTYLDSGGAGALVQMYLHVLRRGGQLKLVHPSACTTRVLQFTHLSSVFEIFDDEEAAVRSLNTPAA